MNTGHPHHELHRELPGIQDQERRAHNPYRTKHTLRWTQFPGSTSPRLDIYDRAIDNLPKIREENDLGETGQVPRDDNWNDGSRFNNKAIEHMIAAREAAGGPPMATQTK